MVGLTFEDVDRLLGLQASVGATDEREDPGTGGPAIDVPCFQPHPPFVTVDRMRPLRLGVAEGTRKSPQGAVTSMTLRP